MKVSLLTSPELKEFIVVHSALILLIKNAFKVKFK